MLGFKQLSSDPLTEITNFSVAAYLKLDRFRTSVGAQKEGVKYRSVTPVSGQCVRS